MARGYKAMAISNVALAVATGIVAALGVFGRGDGATVIVESVRGETYDMTTNGLYAFNARRVVAEGVGWDVFTLLFVVPAMLAVTLGLVRGLLRARLFVLGLLAYLFYQYLMYAMTWAFGPLTLPFVALFAASLWGLVWVGSSVAREPLADRFDERFPRRGMAALCFILSAVLVAMWLARISAGLRGDLTEAMLLGQTTLVVQALDLGLVVPLAVFTGVMALRRGVVGYVLSSVLIVKAFAMSTAICAMVIGAWRAEGTLSLGGLAIFGSAALVSLVLGLKMYRSTHEGETRPHEAKAPLRLAPL
jgi:hypothetical protein